MYRTETETKFRALETALFDFCRDNDMWLKFDTEYGQVTIVNAETDEEINLFYLLNPEDTE